MKEYSTKSRIFRVDSDLAESFIAVADLLSKDGNELLGKMIKYYVESVRGQIKDHAESYPSFAARYPFISSSDL